MPVSLNRMRAVSPVARLRTWEGWQAASGWLGGSGQRGEQCHAQARGPASGEAPAPLRPSLGDLVRAPGSAVPAGWQRNKEPMKIHRKKAQRPWEGPLGPSLPPSAPPPTFMMPPWSMYILPRIRLLMLVVTLFQLYTSPSLWAGGRVGREGVGGRKEQ